MPRKAEIDRAILAKLRKNGRMSYVDLAAKVEASERTVRTHIRNMEENGTIRGYTIREGGVGLTALVRIKVAPGSEIGSFASEVTGWDGIEIIYEVSGEADLVSAAKIEKAAKKLLYKERAFVFLSQKRKTTKSSRLFTSADMSIRISSTILIERVAHRGVS